MTTRFDVTKPFSIIIVGGGTAGWMAANFFAHSWADKNVHITLVESPDIGTVGVGEGSTPSLKRFFAMLGIEDSEWMAKCNATYKVNIKFDDWSPGSGIASYSHPFTTKLDTFTRKAFFVNCRTRRLGLDTHTKPADFFINGELAKQHKGPITPANFPFPMEYGYHFDSQLLGKFLAEHGSKLGVRHHQAKIAEVKQHANNDIRQLITEQGEVLEADFFVDCTGFYSLLMQKTLEVPFKSYKDNLFNDSALVMPTPIGNTTPCETTSTAIANGWCWHIPLTHRVGNGYVYSSDFVSKDQAETEFRQHLGMLDSPEACRFLPMKVGCLTQHWQNNCLGIGLSQGFIEPLEATALHLVQISLELFADKFEEGKFGPLCRAQYNHQTSERFEGVRDYIVAHYKLNTRMDSDFWRANRENEVLSDSLLQLLDVWYKREDLEAEISRQGLSSHFNAESWHCLLAGYGAFPPLAASQPGQGDLYLEQSIEKFVTGCAMNFAPHLQNLETFRK
jgi:hypothetical protein